MLLTKPRNLSLACHRFCNNGVPDKITPQANGFHVGWLKRQQRQHLIHMFGHFLGPFRAPGPNRRRHIMDTAQATLGFHLPRHTQAEIGTIDGHHHVRLPVQRRLRRLMHSLHQMPVFGQHLGNTHNAQLIHGKQALKPLRGHQRAAYPGERRIRHQMAQPLHERRAKSVARQLASDQKHFHQITRDNRNNPVSSSAASVLGRSSTTTRPADTTMPSTPALAAARTVSGPIAGISTRKSCPRFGAFRNTPLPRRKCFGVSATKRSIASVP
mmetsp:Transcript_29485/g.57792  ORF Transcript_29485/g.57792 Transcript_29485/m.57792 type:complete len:270 (+) Transcript_29485:809-1618(+)